MSVVELVVHSGGPSVVYDSVGHQSVAVQLSDDSVGAQLSDSVDDISENVTVNVLVLYNPAEV